MPPTVARPVEDGPLPAWVGRSVGGDLYVRPMRILHTSDWHLGRSLHGVAMLDHQAEFVDHLLAVVESERVDLVVVSGDVYDRALPPVDAVRLANDALTRLADSRARVVISSGNHDSAQRLGFGAGMMDAAGVHVRTRPDQVDEPVLVEDAYGTVAVYALPYLDPEVVREAWQLPERSHEAALAAATSRVRRDLSGRSARSVMLAHAFVAGAAPSDSERDISVGGVARVPVPHFEGVDYAALGHLHGPHTLTEHVRYSGSPLAYSFSEAGHTKGSWLIDLDAGGLAAAEFVPAPVPRPLARISGTLEELLTQEHLAHAEGAWVEATLTDDIRPRAPMERLRERFPHALLLRREAARPAAPAQPRDVRGSTDHDVTREFVAEVRGVPASEEESALLRRACEACAEDRDVDPAGAVG